MSDKHANFNADELFRRKDQFCGFKFCPRCGKVLQKITIEDRIRVHCPDSECGYIFYQNPIPAAGAIIVENDQVLLVKRAYPPRINWWCIPAGFMEWDEHPSETAVRELEEETGLKVKLTSLFDVYSGNDDPRLNAILVLYLAKVVGGKMQANDDALDVAYFGFNNLPEKIAFEAHVQALADYDLRYRRK
ncbi:MAG: hypothetical protein DRP45_07835 [Candidatus Zixiibacteriota bacterium]|nr:MAG: hypothetical protein DRP45_07835 [candidate division Zixibacteria bacterium]